MRRRKIRLRYKKERVLLSDVLPYELPFTFSNRGFYRFLVKNQITIENNTIHWDAGISEGALAVLAFMINKSVSSKNVEPQYNLDNKEFRLIPFTYNILHKPNRFRELSIVHPLNQIQIVEFYEKYKSLILYYTGLDRFSLRHPNKVACYFYYKDRLHRELLGRKSDRLELFFNEYENLKSYFSYDRYNNIYKFYEDYRYQRAEKRFSKLMKFDIQSCFDSIYTHSISWALGGGKDTFKEKFDGPDNSFGGLWDKLMRNMNNGETNGIVIGPEFSRIFAEVILQHVDKRVDTILSDKYGITYNKDYACYRYVDDYFFFYNDDEVCEKAMVLFTNILKEFKLNISSEKTIGYNRPFVTDISRAKLLIDRLVDDNMKLKIEEDEKESEDEDSPDTDEDMEDEITLNERLNKALNAKISWYFSAKSFNVEFKSILKSCNVGSKDIVNYTLARIYLCLDRSLKKFIKLYKPLAEAKKDGNLSVKNDDIDKRRMRLERTLETFLLNVLDSVFFMYSSNQRVNTTLKMMSILNVIIISVDSDFIDIKAKRFSQSIRDVLFMKIKNEVSLVFQRSRHDDNAQIESLYLLLLIKRLRSKYHLSEYELRRYLGIKADSKQNTIPNMNAIAIEILLYYFGNEQRYRKLKSELKAYVIQKYKMHSTTTLRRSAEMVILTLDLFACPYISKEYKWRIASTMNVSKNNFKSILRYFRNHRSMFMRWEGVDITKELNAKVSQEVYA